MDDRFQLGTEDNVLGFGKTLHANVYLFTYFLTRLEYHSRMLDNDITSFYNLKHDAQIYVQNICRILKLLPFCLCMI
jgi:hypothetical protein